MSRKNMPEFSYDERTGLYRKKIKTHDGKWVPVYGKTKQDVRERIRERQRHETKLAELCASPIFYQYAQSWFASLPSNLSSSRKSDFSLAINKHICPYIGGMRLTEITPATLARLMAGESHMSKSMQQKTVSALKGIFEMAEADGLIARSPCSSIRAGGAPTEEKHALTNEQQETLLSSIEETRAYPFCLIGLCTGMRREEILALQWDAVVLDCDTPYVEVCRALRWENNRPVVSSKLKSKAARRTIPIPSLLSNYLRQAKEVSISDYVVASRDGNELTQSQFKNLWSFVSRRMTGEAKRTRIENGLPMVRIVNRSVGEVCPNHTFRYSIDFHVTPHILRHTYISRLILSGVNLKLVQYLAGHSKIETTLNIYTHLTQNQPEDTYEFISDAFSSDSPMDALPERTAPVLPYISPKKKAESKAKDESELG